ncbi:MAG: iron-sulfur cluster repair protein YtfE [Planctomycetes bacterium]|nr:iron-sulfur cluster repair protein YtfE [Planctomycetota bacterium]
MTTDRLLISPGRTLADLAVNCAGASRIFHRHRLDFCCGGGIALEEACAEAGLDLDEIVSELQLECESDTSTRRLDELDVPALIEHILRHYHEPHREEVPRLIEMAEKVEHVHAERATCPRGLAAHLRRMGVELEEHMQKEEQVLFPLLIGGGARMALMPIKVMEQEHRDHGTNLEKLVRLTNDFTPPEDACVTWRALYAGLEELRRELMDHIHIENNLLFPKAVQG